MQILNTNNPLNNSRGGGGNNLSLNPQKSSLRSSLGLKQSTKTNTQKADSNMDCHAVQAPLAMTEKIAVTTHTAPSKSASLSLACAIALSSAVLIPNQAKADWVSLGSIKGSSIDGYGTCTRSCKFSFIAYMFDNRGGRPGLTFNQSGANVGTLNMNADASQSWGWRNVKLQNSTTITTTNATGTFMVEFKASGSGNNSTLTTINNSADRLSLSADVGSSISVTTLNQSNTPNTPSELVLQNGDGSITIENLNQSGGTTYQKDGDVTTATMTDGAYYQGYGPSGGGYAPVGDGGQIGTLNLQGGDFTQYAGQITDVNQSGGSFTQQVASNQQATIGTLTQSGGTSTQTSGSITNLNLSGGTFTHNGGTLSNVVLKAGGNGSTFVNGTNSAFDNITQEGGNHTIIGKVTKFTLASGSFTNNGSIETLTTNTTTRDARSANTANTTTGTSFYAAQATATNHITNNGTIDNLTLNEATDVVNVLDDHNKPIGIIKKLDVKSGNSTINTLTGVAQDPTTGISNINITANDAKLTVDTLRVGLKGNQAIERVTINNNTGQGSNKEFAVNKIQVTYIDGTFDPAKSISNTLKDYVSSNTISQSYVDSNSKPTFESSPELQGIGVKFNPDGTPIFEVEASLAASMTSVVVRQSMRRKMLIDTYLAEQNRRSLKNKERRTKQRIEAATLADARAQYQKDLAKYKLDLAKWDKLASTKENKALIAKYEQEDKAYQAAKAQYDKDKKAYEDNRKNLELLSKAQKIKAPIEPKAPVMPKLKPSDKHYKKAMADYDKAQKAYEKAMSKYEQELRIYTEENNKLETIARASNLKAPIAPKAPIRPNLKPNHKDYKRVMAAYESNQRAYQAALKQYELDKKSYEEKRKRLEVLAKTSKFNANLKAPTEPKAPVRPNLKPNHKDYKKAMSKYEQERKDYLKDFKQYEQDKKSYEREYQKLIALADAQSNKLKAPIQPKAPTKPKILASKPEMPQEPKLGEISAELLAKHKVQGDFFIRAYGGTGSHKATNGAQTSSWSVGTLFGSTWDLALGQTSGNIGFYGGYEYIYNGYKQAHIDAQGHTGFLGLRFSHIFAKTKLAGFYYMADVNGGYSDISIGQDMNGMRFSANVGNINFGSSFRLGSSVYMYGAKSILFPSVGVGVEGGYLGEFEMRTNRSGELRYGGLSQGYAVTYAQANLNYYQEYGKRLSTTLGGGFRYLMNTDINIMPTLNGKAYTIDEKTGRAAAVHVAPFFYQGTFVINYHTDKLGNFSAGYVAVGGELGITHNASVRWHYFF